MPAAMAPAAAIFRRDCQSCHGGPALTDNRFHRISSDAGGSDKGLADVTGRPEDEGRFRTPSLRNVTQTAPYFHDGRAADLSAALRRHGVPAADAAALIPYLGMLTGERLQTDVRFALPARRCGRTL